MAVESGSLTVRGVVVGPFQENCWVLKCEATGEAILVDPGDEPERISDLVQAMGARPVAIYLTHTHIDHVCAVAPLQQQYGIPVRAPEADRAWLKSLPVQAVMFGLRPPKMPRISGPIADGDAIRFGRIEGRAIATPGHTLGGTCFYFERDKVLITGDTLFAGSVGRTDLPGGHWDDLVRSIRERLFCLPDDVAFYSGHGERGVLGEERRHNPFVGDDAVASS